MTIQEVLSIKEDKSQKTMNMSLSELKDYYANSLRDFNSIMDKLIGAKPHEIENHICAEGTIEYAANK